MTKVEKYMEDERAAKGYEKSCVASEILNDFDEEVDGDEGDRKIGLQVTGFTYISCHSAHASSMLTQRITFEKFQ